MTQKEIVIDYFNSNGNEPTHYSKVSEDTEIKVDNMRRILGMGVHDNTFIRVDKGIYIYNQKSELKNLNFFEKNKVYQRSDIHDEFGGNRRRGISPSSSYPFIFLFSNPRHKLGHKRNKKPKLYLNKWENNLFYYSGEGTKGDMKMTEGNKSVWEHIDNNKEIHLFEKLETTKYEYVCQLELQDLHYFERKDKEGKPRQCFQFIFEEITRENKRIHKKSKVRKNLLKNIEDFENKITTKEGKIQFRLHKSRERKGIYPKLKKEQHLKEYGFLSCEVCNFNFSEMYGERGDGFIECHHNIPLSELKDEKPTKLSDLTLLCSNCHRMIHRKSLIFPKELKNIINNEQKK